jgi:rhodanese-related sulfurtransferase
VAEAANSVQDQAAKAASSVPDKIESAKSTLTAPVPTPPAMSTNQASAEELLKRLKWGEPALTILDVRSREAFNNERITGAVPMPMEQIPAEVEATLEYKRDIYVYDDSDDRAAEAAQQLRQAGYQSVAHLQCGLSAWKAIGGATEGVYAFSSPARS